jgi:GGDEF domain-containing protein
LEKAIAEALETNEAMSLMLTDIDHFKTFNDNFGPRFCALWQCR